MRRRTPSPTASVPCPRDGRVLEHLLQVGLGGRTGVGKHHCGNDDREQEARVFMFENALRDCRPS